MGTVENKQDTDTHLRENPVSEATTSPGPSGAVLLSEGDFGDALSLGMQVIWPQETEDGRHSRDFMTADDNWLLME